MTQHHPVLAPHLLLLTEMCWKKYHVDSIVKCSKCWQLWYGIVIHPVTMLQRIDIGYNYHSILIYEWVKTPDIVYYLLSRLTTRGSNLLSTHS